MLEILEMRSEQVDGLLSQVGYGHLACSRDDQPYVLPIYYTFEGGEIYVYTTAGLKSEIIANNPKVCLQVEEINDDGAWRSVVVMGEAHEVVDPAERDRVIKLIRLSNPNLLPALAIKWANDWMRKNTEVVYRITIRSITGKCTSEIKIAAAKAQPAFCPKPLHD